MALQIGLAATAVVALHAVGAGIFQRRGKQTGYAATLAGRRWLRGVAIWFMPERPAVVSRAVAGAEAWSESAVACELERASRCSSISPRTGA